MPTYEFIDQATNEYVELYLPVDTCRIGDTHFDEGRELVRIASRPQQVNEKPIYFTSMQLPQHWPYAKHFDSWGSPQFSSKKELNESLAKAVDHGEHYSWDGGKSA